MKTWTMKTTKPRDPEGPSESWGGPVRASEIHKVPHGPVYLGYDYDAGPDAYVWGERIPTGRLGIGDYYHYANAEEFQDDVLRAGGVTGELDGRPLRLTFTRTWVVPYSGKLDVDLDGQLWRMRLRSFLPSRAVLYAPDGSRIASIPAWPPPWRVKIAADATPDQVALAVLLRPVHLAVSHKSETR